MNLFQRAKYRLQWFERTLRRWTFRFQPEQTKATFFWIACMSGDARRLKKWIRIQPGLVNQEDNCGNRPLTSAIFHFAKADTVELLLEAGADPNFIYRYSPLLWAAIRGNFQIMEVVKRFGGKVLASESAHFQALTGDAASLADTLSANPNLLSQRMFDDMSLLHSAAMHGRLNCIELLVQRGADLNAQDSHGQTPLFVAARHGHEDAVKFFSSVGADSSICDRSGWTPSRAAESGKHEAVVRLLR